MNDGIIRNEKGDSGKLAKEEGLFEVWDASVEFPKPKYMEDPGIITQVAVAKAKEGEFHYLHEATVAWHKGRFFVGWSNHKTHEDENRDEQIRGCTSLDGLHWTEPTVWVAAPFLGLSSFNHPLLFEYGEVLYGFFVAWKNGEPYTEIFTFDDEEEKWIHHDGAGLAGFVPFCTPQLMENGNWIMWMWNGECREKP